MVSVSDKQSPTETSHVALKVSCDLNKWENARYFFLEKGQFWWIISRNSRGREYGVVYNILVGAAEQ